MLGVVWLCIPYQQQGAEPERLVILEGGQRVDFQLIRRLEQVIEWHARAVPDGQRDTWHAGKFLLEWTDESTYDTLKNLFSDFSVVGSQRSLWALVCLYSRLAGETARLFGYHYPAWLDQQISGCIRGILNEAG